MARRADRRLARLRSRWAGLAALALTLPVAALTIPRTLDWVGRPFPGFWPTAARFSSTRCGLLKKMKRLGMLPAEPA